MLIAALPPAGIRILVHSVYASSFAMHCILCGALYLNLSQHYGPLGKHNEAK